MNMGFKNMRDLHIILFRNFNICVDITLWVNDCSYTIFLTAYEITSLC